MLKPLHLSSFTATSAVGRGRAATLEAMRQHRSGLQPCALETVDLKICIGEVAGVDDVTLAPHLAAFDCRNNRLAQLALEQDDFAPAVRVAIGRYDASRIGVFIGTSTSGILQTELAFRRPAPVARVGAGSTGTAGAGLPGQQPPRRDRHPVLNSAPRDHAWDPLTVQCDAISHRDLANPLRAHGQLGAVCGVEYAAQAMAIHGALLAPPASALSTPRAGYLVSVRSTTLQVARLDDIEADLLIEATCLTASANNILYAFSVSAAGRQLLAGRAAVVLDAAAQLNGDS